jgi:hypothetical protein
MKVSVEAPMVNQAESLIQVRLNDGWDIKSVTPYELPRFKKVWPARKALLIIFTKKS